MKNLIVGLVLLIAFNANTNAAIYNETTSLRLDSEFVSSGDKTHVRTLEGTPYGLEWLNFGDNSGDPANNISVGYSINQVATEFAVDNFRVATKAEVTNLFDFFFPEFDDTANGNGTMDVLENPSANIIQERNSWLTSFGTDIGITNGAETSDVFSSWGWYWDEDTNSAQVAGLQLNMGLTTPSTSFYNTDYTVSGYNKGSAYAGIGVFMVRDYVPAVPIPAAVWLFASGLLGLVAVARRRS